MHENSRLVLDRLPSEHLHLSAALLHRQQPLPHNVAAVRHVNDGARAPPTCYCSTLAWTLPRAPFVSHISHTSPLRFTPVLCRCTRLSSLAVLTGGACAMHAAKKEKAGVKTPAWPTLQHFSLTFSPPVPRIDKDMVIWLQQLPMNMCVAAALSFINLSLKLAGKTLINDLESLTQFWFWTILGSIQISMFVFKRKIKKTPLVPLCLAQ